MSRYTKRKYVADEVLNTYELPTEEQSIVKVVRNCGNNLHAVVTADGVEYLASMPPRFRNHIWIKRGNFVVVDPIEEGMKVKGEIAQILLKDQIKYFKEQKVWPKAFSDPVSEKEENEDDLPVNANQPNVDISGSSESEDDDDLFVNTNRPTVDFSSSSESESEDEGDK